MKIFRLARLARGLLLLAAVSVVHAETAEPFTRLTTPEGIEFGLIGQKPASPAPTLFAFSSELRVALTGIESARLLAGRGFIVVSLDSPCHGSDNPEKFKSGLAGWRTRIEKGDTMLPAFTAKCSRVLDHLIREGYTDPKRVAACGVSRGGFIALHFMAAEPRVRCAAAFAPVTNLLALGEFKGMERSEAVHALSLAQSADKLHTRPIWVCIGNKDRRVSTDDAIAFTRAVVEAAAAQKRRAPIELHVMPQAIPGPQVSAKEAEMRLWKGHGMHATAQPEAAAWIEARLGDGG